MSAEPISDLAPKHQAMLDASAISRDVAVARGYRTITSKAEIVRLGFADYQARTPALLVPVHGVEGEIVLHQLRPDDPRIKDRKPVKYETPSGARMRLDVPSAVRAVLGDASVPLIFTEGIKKVDAIISAGGHAIGLLGVYNFRGTDENGEKADLSDFNHINLAQRVSDIAYDSDVMTNPRVKAALDGLTALLRKHGARVRHIYLPTADGGGKQGIDDFLAAGHTMEDVYALARDAPPYEPDVDGVENTDLPRLFATYGPDELKAMPPLEFRIEGWLPENNLIGIIGKSGDMKSFFALDQAFTIATDRTWNGCDVRGGPVLYVAAEGRSGLGQRITAWETARHVTLDNDRFRLITDAPQMLTDEHVDALIATAKRWQAEVVWLDTLARTMDGEENSTRDMGEYVKSCNRIQRETGATVCVVHHMGWNGERQRGSSALFAAMDAEITITRDGDTVTAKVTKAKDFPNGAEMIFAARVVELPNGGSSVVLDRNDADVPEMTGTAKRVGNLLWDNFGERGATNTEWEGVCKEVGIAGRSFFHARTDLDKGGFVQGPDGYKRGHHYTITEKFAPFLKGRETPESTQNPLEPSEPSFSPSIAGSKKMTSDAAFHGEVKPSPETAHEGFQGSRAESPAIAVDSFEGSEGFTKVPEGSGTFGRCKESEGAKVPPPFKGGTLKPSDFPSAHRADDEEESGVI